MLKAGSLVALVMLLTVVPSAGAWTRLSTSALDNGVDPSPVVLANGTELVAYREPRAHAVVVSVDGKTKTVAKGLAAVGDPRLVLQPNGSLVLFVSDQDGVVSYTSQNGTSWTGPAQTKSTDTGDVQAAAARKDGTPLFSQDGTGFLNVFQGAGGEVMHNVFSSCCGYAESLAVDSHGLAQAAFWSNASGHGGYLYAKLGATGSIASLKTLSTGTTAENDARVPLVADASGNTYVAFANGYPSPNALFVETLRGGGLAHKVTLAHGTFTGNEPLTALAVDASGRLWAVWTQGGSVWAARSRSHGAHFGAAVHVASPGSTYALEAAARTDGLVDAIVNNGSSLQTERLLPGLTVQVTTQGARVLDDGFPVAGATVRAGGGSTKTNAAGLASFDGLPHLAPHTVVSVTATGYAPAGGTTP
ncbi:MAG TPA: hypothetical protein VGL76_09945 [Gaiellaceae bacterium]